MPVYLLIINAGTLVLMFLDKRFAMKKSWRIPEAALLGAAALGGSLGLLVGMALFHHKTRKPKFYLTAPLLLAFHLYLLLRFVL